VSLLASCFPLGRKTREGEEEEVPDMSSFTVKKEAHDRGVDDEEIPELVDGVLLKTGPCVFAPLPASLHPPLNPGRRRASATCSLA
jgi:hypothetical protein